MSQHTKEVEKQKNIEENIASNKSDSSKTDPSQDNITKKGEKRYDIDTLKRPLNDDEEKEFKKLEKEDQKKFIIRQWVQENRTLDKKDMHEISLEEEKLIGLQA